MANKDQPPSFLEAYAGVVGDVGRGYQGPDGLTPIGAEDVRQQAVSGAIAQVDGGSDPAGEWQPSEQSKIMFGGYATH
jgi:hypothetical protein